MFVHYRKTQSVKSILAKNIFGLILKNDVEFSIMASYKKNKNATFDIYDSTSFTTAGGQPSTDGRTLNGNTQIIFELSKYNLWG